MGEFVKGDVVVVPFPFSDLTSQKRRPALVVARLAGDDVILCQITSRAIVDTYAIPVADADFATGGLRQDSNIRPNRLFTVDANIILYRAGTLSAQKVQEVLFARSSRSLPHSSQTLGTLNSRPHPANAQARYMAIAPSGWHGLLATRDG